MKRQLVSLGGFLVRVLAAALIGAVFILFLNLWRTI